MSIATEAIQAVMSGKQTFCKFLSANDTGETGGHQAGIYISKPSIPILFDTPGIKGENKEKWVKVRWPEDLITDTRFIYYGKGTRNEYRITNFGRGFPYLRPEYTGALFVFVQETEEDYKGFVLNTEEEIEEFLNAFGLSPAETNCLLDLSKTDVSLREQRAIEEFISGLGVDFPTSEVMSKAARMISYSAWGTGELPRTNPDKAILDWTDEEYKLFRALEQARYGAMIKDGFVSVEEFVTLANQVLNRRKSRAGKSLEHHLAALFDENHVSYTAQPVTEGNKRPDFVFPSEIAYHDFSFPTSKLTTLAAKTTCKDRWRQILNEANRLRDDRKYLCTLQQGISAPQMDEMEAEKVVLVVPRAYIGTYPRDRQDRIWTIGRFISHVKELQDG